jgi:rubredoxin
MFKLDGRIFFSAAFKKFICLITPKSDMELITIKTFDNTSDAYLLKSKLESEGIPSVIFDENMVTLLPLQNITFGGIKLKIHSVDLDKAKELLQTIRDSSITDDNGNEIICPKCGSNKLYTGFKSTQDKYFLITVFMSILYLIFPFYYKSVYKCKACAYEFEIRP